MGFDGLRSQPEPLCDAAVGESLRHQAENLALPRRQLFQRVGLARTLEDLCHELGVDDSLARGDALESIDELPGVEDAVLEQIATAAVQAVQQAERVARFDVL